LFQVEREMRKLQEEEAFIAQALRIFIEHG
jgi:hypothetical protein